MCVRINGFRVVSAALVGLCASVLVAATVTAQRFSDWTAPENLGPTVNSSANEQHPALSPDGLSLYFATDRPGGMGGADLWVSRRDNQQSPWQAPKPVIALNSGAADFAPAFDPSGHWLFFGSEREGGCGGRDIWLSHRFDATKDDGWATPVNLGCGSLSWPGFDDGPTYFQEGKSGELYFISDRPGGAGGRDVWMVSYSSDRGTFSAPVNVVELSSAADDTRPVVRRDGLEFFVSSSRVGSVLSGATPSGDIWVSRRASTRVSWSVPVNVAELNTSATDGAPTLSADGKTMIFNSNRPGGHGGLDLWIATRSSVNN